MLVCQIIDPHCTVRKNRDCKRTHYETDEMFLLFCFVFFREGAKGRPGESRTLDFGVFWIEVCISKVQFVCLVVYVVVEIKLLVSS